MLGIIASLVFGAGYACHTIKRTTEDEHNRNKAVNNPNITGTYVSHDGFRDIATNRKVIISYENGFPQVIDAKTFKVIRDCRNTVLNNMNEENKKIGEVTYSDKYPFKTVFYYSYGKEIYLSKYLPKYRKTLYQDIKTGQFLIERGIYYCDAEGNFIRYTDVWRNSLVERNKYDPEQEKERCKQQTELTKKRIAEIENDITKTKDSKEYALQFLLSCENIY